MASPHYKFYHFLIIISDIKNINIIAANISKSINKYVYAFIKINAPPVNIESNIKINISFNPL